jgi:hypothetical protein
LTDADSLLNLLNKKCSADALARRVLLTRTGVLVNESKRQPLNGVSETTRPLLQKTSITAGSTPRSVVSGRASHSGDLPLILP